MSLCKPPRPLETASRAPRAFLPDLAAPNLFLTAAFATAVSEQRRTSQLARAKNPSLCMREREMKIHSIKKRRVSRESHHDINVEHKMATRTCRTFLLVNCQSQKATQTKKRNCKPNHRTPSILIQNPTPPLKKNPTKKKGQKTPVSFGSYFFATR